MLANTVLVAPSREADSSGGGWGMWKTGKVPPYLPALSAKLSV